MTARDLFVGLMSGTGLDGVDAALVELAPFRPALINTTYMPLPESLKAQLHALQTPHRAERTGSCRKGRQ